MDLTHNDVRQILKIIDETENLDEVELAVDGLRLHIRRSAGPAVARADRVMEQVSSPDAAASTDGGRAPAVLAAAPVTPSEVEVPEGMIAIRAPMLGSFYRSPAPGEPPFIEVGQGVKADDTVCLIEVMKLFNSIKAGVDGKVARIVASNGDLVEYDQVLILIEPDRAAG